MHSYKILCCCQTKFYLFFWKNVFDSGQMLICNGCKINWQILLSVHINLTY